jgi:Flp pilus assembly protein CpaB
MKKNFVPLVVIALVVAVAATAIFYGLIVSRMNASTSADVRKEPRLVANGNFDKGHVVGPGDFRVVEAANAPPGPRKAEELIGRTLQAAVADGQVFAESFLSRLRKMSLSDGVPSGMRAVTVHIADSSTVVDMLEAGDRVDVAGVWLKTRFGASPEYVAKPVLEDVLVYEVGAKASTSGQSPRTVLTLLAKPEDAQKLLLADASAQLRVVLRNREDRNKNSSNASGEPQAAVRSRFRPETLANPELEVLLIEVENATLTAARDAKVLDVEKWTSEEKAKLWAVSRVKSASGGEVAWRGSGGTDEIGLRLLQGKNQSLELEPWSRRGEERKSLPKTAWNLMENEATLVSGLLDPETTANWRQKLAPGRKAAGATSEVVMIVRKVPPAVASPAASPVRSALKTLDVGR